MRGGKAVGQKLTSLGYKTEFWTDIEDVDRKEVIKEIKAYKKKYEEKLEENEKEAYKEVVHYCEQYLEKLQYYSGEQSYR